MKTATTTVSILGITFYLILSLVLSHYPLFTDIYIIFCMDLTNPHSSYSRWAWTQLFWLQIWHQFHLTNAEHSYLAHRRCSKSIWWRCDFIVPYSLWLQKPPPHWRTWNLVRESQRRLCCCWAATRLCPTLCDPMGCSMPDFPVLHYLLEFAQTHVHWGGDCHQTISSSVREKVRQAIFCHQHPNWSCPSSPAPAIFSTQQPG